MRRARKTSLLAAGTAALPLGSGPASAPTCAGPVTTTSKGARLALSAAAAGLLAPLVLGAGTASAARTPAAPYDLDGDGRPELVVGAPGLTVSGHRAAGGVVVVRPTSAKAPKAKDAKVVTQSTSRVAGASEFADEFGSAVTSADFDGDGYADLAVGLPGEDFSGKPDAGAVTILYGSRTGVSGTRSVQLSEPTGKSARARFGEVLAAGDLDGDGYADLAVGAPDQAVALGSGGTTARGTVTVVRGGKKGITTTGHVQLHGVSGTSEPDRAFGADLVVADADADRRDDLVVLSGGFDSSDDDGDPGSLSVCSVRAGSAPGCHRLVRDDALRGGSAMVVGNVAGDARPEIVVGGGSDPQFDPGHLEVATLTGVGSQTAASLTELYDGDLGLESGGAFADALAVGDVVGDAHDDLVIGAWALDEGDGPVGGRVFVVRGTQDGLATSGNTTLDQDTPGVPGSAEYEDDFGRAVTLVDRNGDGRRDLVVGTPGEDGDSGRVTTLPGTGSGFTTSGAGAFGLADLGVKKVSGAELGRVLGR